MYKARIFFPNVINARGTDVNHDLQIKLYTSASLWQNFTVEISSPLCVVWIGLPFDSPVLKASALINKVIYSNFPYQNAAI